MYLALWVSVPLTAFEFLAFIVQTFESNGFDEYHWQHHIKQHISVHVQTQQQNFTCLHFPITSATVTDDVSAETEAGAGAGVGVETEAEAEAGVRAGV